MIILFKRCDRADEVVQVVAVVVVQEREHFALGFDLCEALGKSALDYDIAIAVRLPCPCGGISGDRPVFRLQLYGLFLQVHVGSAFLSGIPFLDRVYGLLRAVILFRTSHALFVARVEINELGAGCFVFLDMLIRWRRVDDPGLCVGLLQRCSDSALAGIECSLLDQAFRCVAFFCSECLRQLVIVDPEVSCFRIRPDIC